MWNYSLTSSIPGRVGGGSVNDHPRVFQGLSAMAFQLFQASFSKRFRRTRTTEAVVSSLLQNVGRPGRSAVTDISRRFLRNVPLYMSRVCFCVWFCEKYGRVRCKVGPSRQRGDAARSIRYLRRFTMYTNLFKCIRTTSLTHPFEIANSHYK